jgi:predicted transcriptional regulator
MSLSEPERLTEVLPMVRCTPSLKDRLERIAAKSVTRNLTDHIRYAVELYVEGEEGRQMALAGRIEDEQ